MPFDIAKGVKAASAAEDKNKRTIEEVVVPAKDPRGTKVPRASQVVVENAPNPSATSTQKLSANAPVQVVVQLYSNCASDLWESFKGQDDQKIWQCQIAHPAPRAVTYQFREKFNTFLHETAGVPDSIQQLQDECSIRYILGDKNDPQDIGFVQWRSAFYAVGDEDSLNNFLLLLDGFWVHLAEKMAREKNFDVHIHTCLRTNVDKVWDTLEYDSWSLHPPAPSAELPLKVFESRPPFGTKVCTMSVEVDDDSHMSIVISNAPFATRDKFEAAGIKGGRCNATLQNPRGEYVRVLKAMDVTNEEDKQRFDNILEKILMGLVVRVVLVNPPEEGETPVTTYIAMLREKAQLHFV